MTPCHCHVDVQVSILTLPVCEGAPGLPAAGRACVTFPALPSQAACLWNMPWSCSGLQPQAEEKTAPRTDATGRSMELGARQDVRKAVATEEPAVPARSASSGPGLPMGSNSQPESAYSNPHKPSDGLGQLFPSVFPH